MWAVDHIYGLVWPIIADILIRHRGIFICVFLLPISVLSNVYDYITKVLLCTIATTPAKHQERVETIAISVKKQAGTGNKLTTDRPGWATMSLKDQTHKKGTIKIPMRSLLVDIVSMSTDARTITVEPLVNMGQISRYLIPKGWTLAVLPELDELTVGGLLMGFGIESSSHIYGLFQDICVEYEVMLGDGSVVRARADNEYADLFYALPWSYGTIGLVMSATLKIIPCKPFIRMSYRRFDTMESFGKAIEDESRKKDEKTALFIEGLGYSATSGVLMTASFVDSPKPDPKDKGCKYNDIGLWHKRWFYEHVQDIAAPLKGDGSDEICEIVPLRAYYHRHTRAIFWEMQYIIPFANQAWFRYLFGWAIPPNIPLMKATQTKSMKKMWLEDFCVQDMLVPVKDIAETVAVMDKEVAIYPMWFCPHLVYRNPLGGFLKPSKHCPPDCNEELFVDIGVYGAPTRKNYEHNSTMRRLEEFVRQKGGYQGLYAVCYMNRGEFRTMFDHRLYDACRKKYNAVERFPEAFDKTCGVPQY